jgi:hypothetical protein
MEKIGNRIRVTVAACGLALLLGAPARAADFSPWVEDNYSGIRLIAGASKSGAESLSAGIEIKMQPGWHAAAFQFCRLGQSGFGDGAVSGAACFHRRGRHHDRL